MFVAEGASRDRIDRRVPRRIEEPVRTHRGPGVVNRLRAGIVRPRSPLPERPGDTGRLGLRCERRVVLTGRRGQTEQQEQGQAPGGENPATRPTQGRPPSRAAIHRAASIRKARPRVAGRSSVESRARHRRPQGDRRPNLPSADPCGQGSRRRSAVLEQGGETEEAHADVPRDPTVSVAESSE